MCFYFFVSFEKDHNDKLKSRTVARSGSLDTTRMKFSSTDTLRHLGLPKPQVPPLVTSARGWSQKIYSAPYTRAEVVTESVVLVLVLFVIFHFVTT